VVTVVEVGTGRLQDMVTKLGRTEAQLMITCAFKTLAMQRSHSDVKSAAVTAGGGLAQASSPMLAQTSPLNTLAHVRETGEVGGGGEERG
jgi:hypothetical protein